MFCGRYFAWKATRALHEQHCRGRPPRHPAAAEGEGGEDGNAVVSRDDGDTARRGMLASSALASRSSDETKETSAHAAASPSSFRANVETTTGDAGPRRTSPLAHGGLSPSLRPHSLPSPKLSPARVAAPATARATAAAAKTQVFTCPDCELDVSSRTKLRRHQRYYCPFREDVFADPLADAVVAEEGGRYSDAEGSDTASDAVYEGDEDDLSEEERAFGKALAQQAGLRFYNNANTSDESESEGHGTGTDDDGDGVEEKEEEESGSDVEHLEAVWLEEDEGSISDESLESADEFRVPLRRRGKGRELDEMGVIEEEDDDGSYPEERLHLDFKRRRSSNKRQRRILLKRLRAQAVGHSSSSSHNDTPQQAPSASPKAMPTTTTTATTGGTAGDAVHSVVDRATKEGRAWDTTDGRRKRSRRLEPDVADFAGDTLPPLSESMQKRAEAVLVSSFKRKTPTEHVCPFGDCGKRFTTRRQWLAHVARMHADEMPTSGR